MAAQEAKALNPAEELNQAVAERRTKLIKGFDQSSAQGILPLTNEDYHEQANPIVRSALFAAIKSGSKHEDWVEIFALGSNVEFKGPQLTVDHEILFTRILVRARGRSLMKPVPFVMTEALQWLDLKDSGPNRNRVRKLLDDLKDASVRIACKSTLKRLHNVLTRTDLEKLPGGQLLRDVVNTRYSEYLPMIMQSYRNNEPFKITLDFINRIADQGKSKRLMVELDIFMALLFDGVNTTLLPFEIWDSLDSYGKKLMPFIASHRDGVIPLLLETYHQLSGSKSTYVSVERRFKSDFKKRLAGYEEKGYIEPGWDIVRNRDDKWIVTGLKGASAIKIKSELLKSSLVEAVDAQGFDSFDGFGDDDPIEAEYTEIAPEQQTLL